MAQGAVWITLILSRMVNREWRRPTGALSPLLANSCAVASALSVR
jgi:hypothetical protein